MAGKYAIVDLDEHHMPDLLRICRQELGPDYHSEADFKKCLGDSREHFCKVILDDEGTVCGFSTAMMMGPESADDYLKLPDSMERDKILSNEKIGIMDAAAVDNSRKGGGLGKLLVGASYNELVEGGGRCHLRHSMEEHTRGDERRKDPRRNRAGRIDGNRRVLEPRGRQSGWAPLSGLPGTSLQMLWSTLCPICHTGIKRKAGRRFPGKADRIASDLNRLYRYRYSLH